MHVCVSVRERVCVCEQKVGRGSPQSRWTRIPSIQTSCPPGPLSRRRTLQAQAPPRRRPDVSLVKRVPEAPGSREVRSGLPSPLDNRLEILLETLTPRSLTKEKGI